jgi:HemY protein
MADIEFGALARLIAASSLHRLQDRPLRDRQLADAEALLMKHAPNSPVREGASMLAAEWALDDRNPELALQRLANLPAGVARRTHALRLKLQADRLASEPLEALKTARLLAKHQGFTPAAAQGLLRSLAVETLDGARDADQLRRLWGQFDPADRRDPLVAAHAARRAVALDAPGDARAWLRPHWDHLATLDESEREAVLHAFVDALRGLPDDWLPPLEAALLTLPGDAMVSFAVGSALAERELWGRARRLLETAGTSPQADADLRRRAWRALANIAAREGDEAAVQRCYREAALSM